MDANIQSFYQQISQAVEEDKLMLPTLPEVALRVRDQIESDDCSITDIAHLLGQDASLTATFIKVANSPLYRGLDEIIDLQTVIGRMGLTVVKDLVMSLALKQIFTTTTPGLDEKFREAWSTGVSVASISRMLAINTPGVVPEQALLAGLVHNIGVLPLLTMMEKEGLEFSDEQELSSFVQKLQGPVGLLILAAWNFPESLQQVVSNCYDFARQHDGDADYTDIVQVSLLQGGYAKFNGEGKPDNIAAFGKLNLDPEVNVIEIEENKEAIENTMRLLSG